MRSPPNVQRAPSCRPRRRGASFVFFLGTALLVATIGLTALAVLRVKLRAARVENDRAVARFNARAAVDFAMLTVASDSDWRNHVAHDTWQTGTEIGDGSFSYKIVDETNGDLTTDPNGEVRVYGKGLSGDAVWIYSVTVQPPPAGLNPNLITNGDLETGAAAPWVNGGDCTVAASADGTVVHSGLWGMEVTNRLTADAGPEQTLISPIVSGSTYYVSLWVKMRELPDTVSITLSLSTMGGPQDLEIARAQVDTSWTHLMGTVTPTWSGSLLNASVSVRTDSTLKDFVLDDVRVRMLLTEIGPLAGTWRREAE
jgi:hypothetical protein